MLIRKKLASKSLILILVWKNIHASHFFHCCFLIERAGWLYYWIAMSCLLYLAKWHNKPKMHKLKPQGSCDLKDLQKSLFTCNVQCDRSRMFLYMWKQLYYIYLINFNFMCCKWNESKYNFCFNNTHYSFWPHLLCKI